MQLRFLIFFFLPLTTIAQTLQDGLKALDSERYREAKQIFSGLIAKEPTNAELLYYKGRVHQALAEKDSAKMMFNKGIAVNAKLPYNYIGLGSIQLDEKDTIQAKANFDKAVAAAPKDAKVFMLTGEAWASTSGKRNIGKAVELLNKSIQLDKKILDAHIILGDAYAQDPDKGGAAMSSYEHAIEADPVFAKGHMKIGLLYMRSRNSDEARKAFEMGVNADSLYAPIFREFAEFHSLDRHFDKACAAYKKYLSLTESNADKLTRYAQLLFLCKDYENTISTTNQVLKTDSSNVILKRLIAYSYYEKGKYPEGLSFMEKFFKVVDPKKVIASDYEYYGRLLAKTGNDSLAIENLNTALAMDSTEIELYGDLGQSYYKKKKYKEAAAAYASKLKKGKQTSADFFLLGKAYYYDSAYYKADTAFIKVTELSPNSHLGFMWRGRANSNIDSTEAKNMAKPFYEKTVELATDTVKYKKDLIEAYQFLGFNAVQNDDDANAKMYFEKLLLYDPENNDAKSVIEQLKKKKP